MGIENLLKIENTMTHTSEFNPNEVYLKKKKQMNMVLKLLNI